MLLANRPLRLGAAPDMMDTDAPGASSLFFLALAGSYNMDSFGSSECARISIMPSCAQCAESQKPDRDESGLSVWMISLHLLDVMTSVCQRLVIFAEFCHSSHIDQTRTPQTMVQDSLGLTDPIYMYLISHSPCPPQLSGLLHSSRLTMALCGGYTAQLTFAAQLHASS